MTPQVGPDLRPPSVLEYSGGINRQYGSRAAIRVDYVFRDWKDFYVNRTDLSTGKVTNPRGQVFDLTLIGNTNDLTRRYSGATVQGTYRVASRADLGATYTLSRLWGNVDGETVNNGATAAAVLQYPEYKQASWNYPDGDLAADQRHRARLWINYFVPGVSGLTVSAMQTLESGVPYGASSTSGVDARVIPNPGYQTPLVPTSTTYFYSARDAYHLDGQKRTDFAVNYSHHVGGGARSVELFTQAAGHQPVQQLPVVRLRRHRLPEWWRGHANQHRSDGAHRRDKPWLVLDLQSVYGHAGAGRQLRARPDLWPGAQPLGLDLTAAAAALVRRALLRHGRARRRSTGGASAPPVLFSGILRPCLATRSSAASWMSP